MPVRPLHTIRAENFLSLESVDLTLTPLNVLVGPNGSGKTNLLKIFAFIGEVAERDLIPAIENFGGLDGLIFQNAAFRQLKISIKGVFTSLAHSRALDEYELLLDAHRYSDYTNEPWDLVSRSESFTFKRVGGPGRRITLKGDDLEVYNRSNNRKLQSEDVSRQTSGLSLLRKLGRKYDAEQIEEIAQLFLSLRLVDIDVRRLRSPRPRAGRKHLDSSGSNVAVFLLRLRDEFPEAFSDIESDMRYILPTFDRFVIEDVGASEGQLRISIMEKPFSEPIPLERASFGTIRAIVLFSMLHDPEPPSLTLIEEIDHGFHPQALDRIVDRLREATERTQIILATHSPALVNRLAADELVLFRRDGDSGGTRIIRPDTDFVAEAKEEYGYELGELWFSGLLDL